MYNQNKNISRRVLFISSIRSYCKMLGLIQQTNALNPTLSNIILAFKFNIKVEILSFSYGNDVIVIVDIIDSEAFRCSHC